MMTEQRIKIAIEHGIATVTLARAEKHNALDMLMFQAIDQAIVRLAKDKTIRVVIVSGEGESFCSGLDVKSVMTSQLNGLKLLWKWWPRQANLAQRVTVGWRKLKVPVIMVLHGKCWGGGMQIALGGDFRIAAPDTSLAIMESRWGLIPDMGGTIALTENMPLDQAMLLAMTSEPLDAASALQHQLITEVATDPMQAAQNLANQLKQRSPDAIQAIKKMYHQIWGNLGGKILAKETINQWKIIFGENRKIAVKRAFGQKDIDYQ